MSSGRRPPVDTSSPVTREERAARNQSLFRAVNEKLKSAGSPFPEVTETNVLICECAALDCIETLELPVEQYEEVRAKPTHFFVLRDHVYPDVESVVAEHDGYVVVEKFGAAGEVATEAAAAL
jgi:hypothetical protein